MRKHNIILLSLLLALPFSLGAQTLRGSYFLDNSLTRTKLNPAFSPRAAYLNIPVLGNTGIGAYSNLGVADVLFPIDGQLYTFLNEKVSAEQFLKGLPKYPGVDLNVDLGILNFGFYTSPEAFWSFESGLVVDASVGIPRSFLEFAKRGNSIAGGTTYSLKGFNAFAHAYAYASVGHSRDLSWFVEGLKVGAKLKCYVSAAYLGLDLGNSSMQLSGDQWTVHTDATGTIASSFLRVVPPAEAGATPGFSLNTSSISPAGYGFGVDLGAEYRLSVGSIFDGLTFSVAALDLGAFFFSKKNVQALASGGDASFVGIDNISLDENADYEGVIQGVADDFLALANFEEVAATKSSVMARTTINAGIEYPFLHDSMSVGLLYTMKAKYNRSLFNEMTLSYNLNPGKGFNLGLNWSFLNAWKTLGWIVEFTPAGGTSLFIGSDYTFFEVMPGIPLPVDKIWTNARFGITFMLGKSRK